jgi:hypothetical protein
MAATRVMVARVERMGYSKGCCRLTTRGSAAGEVPAHPNSTVRCPPAADSTRAGPSHVAAAGFAFGRDLSEIVHGLLYPPWRGRRHMQRLNDVAG